MGGIANGHRPTEIPTLSGAAPIAGAKPATNQSVTKGGTYVLKDAAGNIMRSGRTNDLALREKEHLRDPKLESLTMDPAHRTDSRIEQRGLEQMLHDQYQPPLNVINPVSPQNPRRDEYMDAARRFYEGR